MPYDESSEERWDRYRNLLLALIRSVLPDCKVYLFGSRASGKQKSGSDIDLALDNGSHIDLRVLLRLYGMIEETVIPLHVDLVDLHTASDDLKKEIFRKNIPWKI